MHDHPLGEDTSDTSGKHTGAAGSPCHDGACVQLCARACSTSALCIVVHTLIMKVPDHVTARIALVV
jgi:hypothetical protein